MKFLLICLRNIARNKRRSLMTVMTISLGTLALLLFGGYYFATMFGMEASYVQRVGHLQLFTKGFFEYGVGNPAEYSLYDYQEVIRVIREEPFFKDRLNVITPTLQFGGIVGNFKAEVSKTFFGLGAIPSDLAAMHRYQGKQTRAGTPEVVGLNDQDGDGAVIGVGMTRILRLCSALKLERCQDPAPRKIAAIDAPPEDFSALAALDSEESAGPANDHRPRLDLLAAQVGGAPNVVKVAVNAVKSMEVKELDDSFITINLARAQQLIFGRNRAGITGIIVQLKSTDDLAPACSHLQALFSRHGFDLEVRRFEELVPYYTQVKSFIGSIFIFLSAIMGVVVLFTVANTMSMCVMERINEIGTVRTLGVRRGSLIRQFVLEGGLLGLIGATIGTVLAFLIQWAINSGQLTYIPPGNVQPVPFTLHILGAPRFALWTWLGFVAIAMGSSSLPARKAGRMNIVDALGHY